MPVLQLQPMVVRPATVRERELEAGRLVLRAVQSGHPFLLRRGHAAALALESGPARRPLRRAAEHALDPASSGEEALAGLLGYGAVLERHGEYAEAEAVYEAVLSRRPADSCLALHAARAARKAGHRDAALKLYRRAGEQAGSDTHMKLLVRIGEALVSDAPEAGLTGVIAAARVAGNRNALAVAREERGLLRLNDRRTVAALRDLLVAAGRYSDAQDRIRVLHRAAEALSARGDLPAAREALLAALDLAGESQRSHTVQRLRTVARAMGDELALRRLRGQGSAPLVMLAPAAGRRSLPAATLVHRVRAIRDVLRRPART